MAEVRLAPNQEQMLYGIWAEVEETNKLLRQLVDLLSQPPEPIMAELKETEGCCMKGGAGEPIPCEGRLGGSNCGGCKDEA